jgi:hypothetical protein
VATLILIFFSFIYIVLDIKKKQKYYFKLFITNSYYKFLISKHAKQMVRSHSLIVVLLSLVVLSSQKKLFNDLLTNDNELAYIQPTSDKSHHAKRLVQVLHPCANNLCSSDQVCVKSHTNLSSYECANRTSEKPKKATAKQQKLNSQKQRTICNLFDHRLSLFEEFEGFKAKQPKLIANLKLSVRSGFCPESVLIMFQK